MLIQRLTLREQVMVALCAGPWYRGPQESVVSTLRSVAAISRQQHCSQRGRARSLRSLRWRARAVPGEKTCPMRWSLCAERFWGLPLCSTIHAAVPCGVALASSRPRSSRRLPPLCLCARPKHRSPGGTECRRSPPSCALPSRSPRRMATRAPDELYSMQPLAIYDKRAHDVGIVRQSC
jgi:hypothetical protein